MLNLDARRGGSRRYSEMSRAVKRATCCVF
jgi:hypothetical protein